MGLDISYYSKLTPAPEEVREDDTGYVQIDQGIIDYVESHFPGRTAGLKAGRYLYEEGDGFRAGSYSGYGAWRDVLARIAGYGTAENVWALANDDKAVIGPFVELINFSDCDGVIGPAAAAKLAKDFAELQHRVDHMDDGDGWFKDKYAAWRKAFETAADGGVVEFH